MPLQCKLPLCFTNALTRKHAQGEWTPRLIPNPSFFEEESTSPLRRMPPVGAPAFEIWTTDAGYLFDGVVLGPEAGGWKVATAYRRDVWRRRYWEEVREQGGGETDNYTV